MAEGHTDQSEAGVDEALRCCRCSQWPDKPGLLLACLHSCCARCTDEALARGDGVHVFCPHCDEETEVVEKDLSSSSSLAVRRSSPEESGALVVCDFCPEPAQSQRAEYWCSDCRSHLCGPCKPGHDRFQRSHKDVTPLTESSIADSPVLRMRGALTCRQHNLRYDHVCSTCGGALKCLKCGKECTKSGHVISIVTDEDASLAADQLERLAGSVAGSAAALGSRRHALQQELAADLRDLMARKRHVANVLDEAFGAARDALEETYGKAMAQHERLTKRAACALWRQSSLTSCRHSEPTDFLAHSRHVRDRLQHLSDEAAAARGGAGPSIAVRASTLPDNLLDTMKSWIGLPVLLGSEGQPQASTEGASIDITCPCVIGSAAGTTGQQQQHLWKDVAVTCCGHLLLAAGKSGLQECDTRGRCLSSWPAPAVAAAAAALGAAAEAAGKQEEVIAVDALEDDRAVVGLKFAMTAVLLERDGGLSTCSWHELRRFDLLLRGQSIPFALSARAGLVVVACGTLGDCDRLCPGSAVATFRVSDGRRLHNAELKYAVYGLAVTEQAVVVASYGKVKVDATRERYVVESLDLDLQQSRWVIEFDRRVWDVATSPSGRVLYAAVTDYSTGIVTAIKADDGRLLADDVSMAAGPGASGSSAVAGGGSSSSGGNVAGGSCVFFRSVSDGISLSPNGTGSSSGSSGGSSGSSGGMSCIGDGSSSCAVSSSRCFTRSYHQVRLPSRLSVDKVGNSWLATLSLDSKTVSVIDARFLDGMECRWLSVAQSI